MARCATTAAVVLLLAAAASASGVIRPGGPNSPHWNDTDGNRIEAHGGGMLQEGGSGRWYWYGESKKTSDLSDHGVNCYSADDLSGPWTFEGQVVAQKDIKEPSQPGPYVVERPKVIYNNKTRKYVMWFHLDNSNYSYRHAAIATADKPQGPFTYLYSFQPDNIPSLDMNLFLDPIDGEAYFIRSCDNAYAGISRLTSDYLNTTGLISNHSRFEGMAIFRLLTNHTYYIISSHLTGWNPNPLMLFRGEGKTLDNPEWVDMGNPTGSSTSFDTQPTYVVSHRAADGSLYYIYMADNWVHGGPGGLIDASYVWLPIKFNAKSVEIQWRDEWDPAHPFACPPPQANQTLHLATCNSSEVSQQWTLPSSEQQGSISLRTNKNLCWDTEGLDPGTSTPELAIAACQQRQQQAFSFDASTGTIKHAGDNMCVDVAFCGNDVCPSMDLELYNCGSPHENQNFDYDANTGLLHAKFDNSLCVNAGSPCSV